MPENAKFTTVIIESAAKVCIPASASIGKMVVHGKQTIQDHCDAAFCEESDGEDNHAPEKTFELGCFIIAENAKYSTVTIEATAEVCIPASATIGKVVVEGKQTIQDHCEKAFCDAWGGEGGANRRLTEDNHAPMKTFELGCFIIAENAKYSTVTIEATAEVCIPASATIGKVVVEGKQTIQDHCDKAFCDAWGGEGGANRRLTEHKNGADGADDDEEESSESTVTSVQPEDKNGADGA